MRGVFGWAPVSRRWLGAAFVWWCLLVLTGWLDFLPGISERVKFTNVLVAHSHLAMAGMVTSLNVALLLNLGPAHAPSLRSFGCGRAAVRCTWPRCCGSAGARGSNRACCTFGAVWRIFATVAPAGRPRHAGGLDDWS